MNPVLPLAFLIPLIVVGLGGAIWTSWTSSRAAPISLRRVLLVLRVAALLALAVFLLNPGRWQAVETQVDRVWAVMIDRSRSMSVREGGENDERRIDTALAIGKEIGDRAENAGVQVRYFSYDQTINEEEEAADVIPDGSTSDLTTAADTLLTQLSSQGEPLAGVFVLGDGRQTHIPRHSNLNLRARALNVPFHAIPIGGAKETKDLSLEVPRKTVTAFPGQNVQITAALSSQGLDNLEAALVLTDAEGTRLNGASLTVNPGEKTVHTFSLKAPEQSALISLEVEAHPDEVRVSNNQAEVRIRILDEKARVFIAEGAPYWDSKFLAQLLRQQSHMEVASVHRLSDTRWFRIDSGESIPHESAVDVFPDTAEELMSYDLIIFGKNSEHFLTQDRIALLRSFVSDQGGAILFSRSKPYSGVMPDLTPLEPVSWKPGLSGEFTMRPSADGQAAGLFGDALPAPDSSVWDTLPPLKDAHRIDEIKPFTRILASGELVTSSVQGKFPLLLVRRYGQGVTGLVNADGLWKWDFFPEARELGNMYEEFWIQMIHWMLSYSEFLPGQDYSLNVSASTVEPATPVALRMAYRGAGHPDVPRVEVTSPALPGPMRLAPAEIPSDDGRLKWGASFTPEKPGNYRFRLIGPTHNGTELRSPESAPPEGANAPNLPEATVTVLAPPGEMDNPSADPDFLQQFCTLTGGEITPANEVESFLDDLVRPAPLEPHHQGVEWRSAWMRWITPILVLLCLASEWWLRRRNGLV